MATVATRKASVKSKTKAPLSVSLTLTINGTSYTVAPIAPGPDNTKAFRLEKQGGKGEVYDVCRTHFGTVECDCPSYEATYRGNGFATCKHGSACVQVGLFEAPAPDPASLGRKFDGPDAIAARMDELDAPCAPPIPAFDPTPYAIAGVVARGAACWTNAGPKGGPTPPCWTPAPTVEPPPCKACQPEPKPEPPAAEPPAEPPYTIVMPEEPPYDDGLIDPCAPEPETPADDDVVGDGWDDDHVWNITETPSVGLAALASLEAEKYRMWRTDAGDLFAETLEALAAQIRSVDARTPDQFRDRWAAVQDARQIVQDAR